MFESVGNEEALAAKQLGELSKHVTEAVGSGRDIGFNARKLSALFSENAECVFLKDRSGKFIFSNKSCTDFFAHQVKSPIGMKSSTLLSGSMKAFSQISDELIFNGCDRLKFKHPVELVNEGPTQAITIKLPLLAHDESVQGVIGMSRTLRQSWRKIGVQEIQRLGEVVNRLRQEEKLVAKFVCDGISNKHISEKLGVPLRTIENRRRSLLKKLGLGSTAEMIKLFVRLEDAGLIRLGV